MKWVFLAFRDIFAFGDGAFVSCTSLCQVSGSQLRVERQSWLTWGLLQNTGSFPALYPSMGGG